MAEQTRPVSAAASELVFGINVESTLRGIRPSTRPGAVQFGPALERTILEAIPVKAVKVHPPERVRPARTARVPARASARKAQGAQLTAARTRS